MSEIQEHVVCLSQNIDPHPAGTEEEQQAALYLAEEIEKETDFSTSVEEFNCSPNYDMPCVIYCAITVVMGLLTLFVPVLVIPTFILTVITAVLYILDVFGIYSFARFLRAGISQNVVAQYKPASADSDNRTFTTNRKRKIVLVARYDSGKVYRELSGPFFPMLPAIHWIELVAMVLVPILLLLRLATGAAGAFLVVINILIVVCAIFALLPIVKFLVHFGATYNEGANCNAAGVSVLLEVASRIGQGHLQKSTSYTNEPEEVVIHGEAEARAGGLIPENAEIVYEATPNESQSGFESNKVSDDSPEARLAAAKAAIAALSGKPVSGMADIDFSDMYANEPAVDNDSYKEDIQREQREEAVGSMPQTASEKRRPQIRGRENTALEYEEMQADEPLDFEEQKPAETVAEGTAVAPTPDFDEMSDAVEFGNGFEDEKNLSMGVSEADIREAAAIADEGDLAFDVEATKPEANIYDDGTVDEKVPSWFKSAQEKAHKSPITDANKPAQRSRYADALDAAVRESNTYFQQANDAISSETESRLQHMRDSIMEVKPPSFDDIDQELTEAGDSVKTEAVADAADMASDVADITEIAGATDIETPPDSLKTDVDTHKGINAAIASETENLKDTHRGLFGRRSSERAFSRASQKREKASPTRRVANFVRDEAPEDQTREITQESLQEQEPVQKQEAVKQEYEQEAPQELLQEQKPVQQEQEQEPVQEQEAVKQEYEQEAPQELLQEQKPVQQEQEQEPVQEQETIQQEQEQEPVQEQETIQQERVQEAEQEQPISSEGLFASDTVIEQETEQETVQNTHRNAADTAPAPETSSVTGLDRTISFIPVAIDEEQLRKEILEQSNRADKSEKAIGDLPDTALAGTSPAAESQQAKSVIDQASSQTKNNDIATAPESRGGAKDSVPSVKITKEAAQAASQEAQETPLSQGFVVPKVISQSSVVGADETNKASSRKRRDIELPGLTGSLGKTTPTEDDLKQSAPLGDDALLSHSRSQKLKELTFDDGSSKDSTAARRAALRTSLPTLTGSITFEKQTTTTDAAEDTEDESTSEVSQAGSFATGMFDPVGGELIEDVAPEEVYVEDADDSDYEEQFSETGAYTGAGYVEMPKSRASRFFGRFRRSGKNQEAATPQEWLDVNDDFEAREVGKARGSWESFRDDELNETTLEDQDITERVIDETDVSYETDADEMSTDIIDTDDSETIFYETDDNEDYSDDADSPDIETTYKPRSWDGGGFSRASFNEMMEASQKEASSQQESDSENLDQNEFAQDITQDETQDVAQNPDQDKTQVIEEINKETARERNTTRRASRDADEKKTRGAGRKKKRDKTKANRQRAARASGRKPSRVEDMQRIQQFHNAAINTEVWFVALGSELADNGGMKAFIASHADELKGSIIVELEGLGAGDLSLIEKEGTYRSLSSSSRAKRYMRKAAGALRINIGSESMRWKKSSAACAASYGYQVMHIAGMKDGKPAYYGEADDVIENVSEQTMLRNAEFVLEFLKNF